MLSCSRAVPEKNGLQPKSFEVATIASALHRSLSPHYTCLCKTVRLQYSRENNTYLMSLP